MTVEGKDFGYADTHHLIEERVPPPSLVALRTELQKPEHADIAKWVANGKSFEECLGILGCHLDIALDGYYDVPSLCNILLAALRNRRVNPNQPWLADPRLVNAELVEREGHVSLEEGTGTIAAIPETFGEEAEESNEVPRDDDTTPAQSLPATDIGRSESTESSTESDSVRDGEFDWDVSTHI